MVTSASGYDLTPLSKDRIQALAEVLTPDEKHVVWASDRGGSTHLYMTRFED